MKSATSSAKPLTGTRFSSVLDLVKATAGDDQIRTFEQYLADTKIVKALIRSRAAKGLTQADVASRMECTHSAVSKLEHSSDGDLTVREITSYLKATGGRFAIGFGKQPSLVERIKDSAMCLKRDLHELADVSVKTDDSKLRTSIDSFFGEAWFNLFMILCESTEKLPGQQSDLRDSPVKLLGVERQDCNSEQELEASLA